MAKRVVLGLVCALAAVTLHAATFTVVNILDSGAGSLRQAILDSNANGSAVTDLIQFNIPGAGVHSIFPASALDTIATPVTIDGYTQPGSSPNTLALSTGTDAVLTIDLDCSGQPFNGFRFIAGSSGSTLRGIVVERCGTGVGVNGVAVTIAGNFIGTDPTGTLDHGNGSGVSVISALNSTIGGPAHADRNLISGNDNYAIGNTASHGVTIRGNYIGTAPTGQTAIGNADGVLLFHARDNTIDGNLISGQALFSTSNGIALFGDCQDTTITNNRIGTNRTGGNALPNTFGIRLVEHSALAPTRTTIGAAGAGNVIAFSTGDGVSLSALQPQTAQRTTIRYNFLFGNGAYGIDLADDGPTANDDAAFDADTGPNALQNFPAVLSAIQAPTQEINVSGTLHSATSQSYIIDLYYTPQCHSSGFGEGIWAAEMAVVTDATGSASFNMVIPFAPPGGFVSATATDVFGNTSELGACFPVTATPLPTFSIDSVSLSEGNSGNTNAVFTVSLSSPSTSTVQVDVATGGGTAQSGVDFTATSQTLTFLAGETTKQFLVPIVGDVIAEPDETFTVTLSNASNATVATSQGTGTIVNDDAVAATVAIPLFDSRGLAVFAALLIGFALLRLR